MMKKAYLLILFLIFIACIGNSQEVESKLQSKIDSLSIELDKVRAELMKQKEGSIVSVIEKENYQNEDFDSFFWVFMTDSAFQKSRIKFPLKCITWKTKLNGDADLGGEIDTIQISETKWHYDPFYINFATERTQVYDNFKLKLRPSNERVLHWYGVESGGDAKYFFKGFDGKWYLIEKEQLGD
jgi:hypothetical protein